MLRPFGSSDASASHPHAFGRSPPAAATGSTHWLVGPDHAVRAHRLVRSRRARGSAMRSAPPERFSWFCRNRLDTDKCCASDEKGHHCFHANTSTGSAKQHDDISQNLRLANYPTKLFRGRRNGLKDWLFVLCRKLYWREESNATHTLLVL
jgi:hypothetical protein